MSNHEHITQIYGNRLRVRVSGICIQDNKILLVKHIYLGDNKVLWAPPGGGMNFGETALEALKREFLEETGLHIKPLSFLFVHEFFEPPLHAIELFFEVQITGGELVKGIDPEMENDSQVISEVVFKSFPFSANATNLHAVLRKVQSVTELLQLTGYID